MQSPRMPRFARIGCAILVGVAAILPLPGLGALKWESQKIELQATVDDTQATAVFHFRNEGKEPVTITAIQPSCGCTTAELAKRTFAPGETGEIKSVFTFGGGVGLQEKTIQIITSDAPAKPMSLILRVTIPELFTYSTRLLLWRLGEEPIEQSITVTSLKKITAIEVTSDAPNTMVSLVETMEPGTKYRLVIRPLSTSQQASMTVPFLARFADGTARPLVVYGLVR
jgi:hypothetical protein